MKKLDFRSFIFISYTLVLAILVTSYMEGKTYLLNFYLLPILFAAYYFDIWGAVLLILISIVLTAYFVIKSVHPIDHIVIAVQSIIFSVVGLVSGVFQMINNRLNSHLLTASLTDKLTGLYNYGYFTQRVEEEISRADRYNHPLALIMIDIDNFKKYNDTWGHQQGNQLLVNLAQVLNSCKRKSDVLFRYGGEEFCLILPETGRPVESLAERIRRNVEDKLSADKFKITISVGVSYYPYPTKTALSLVERADKALYQAKESGKNQVCVFNG